MPLTTRSSSKRKRNQSTNNPNNHINSTILLNDFVSLPIIISDYDAMNENMTGARAPDAKENLSRESSIAPSDAASSIYSQQKWSTGFSEFADDLWSHMTTGMRQKLREACVEVLKRTEGLSEDGRKDWEFDDDARLLD